MKPSPTRGLAVIVSSHTMFVLACVASPSTFHAKPANLNLITEAEIIAAHDVSVYEVIEHVRPRFMTSRLDLSAEATRRVYVDGVRVGGIDQLRWIPALSVHEIRFARFADGAGGDNDNSGAAIVVTSKR